jgi:hypothetical protein
VSGTAGHGWRSNGPVHVRSGSGRRFAAGRGGFVSSRAAGGGLDEREAGVTGRFAPHGFGRTAAASRAVRAAADGDVSALATLLKATCWPELMTEAGYVGSGRG